MAHERFRDLLNESMDGTLPEAGRRELEAHLERCGECALAARHLRETLHTLRSFPRLEVPPGFTLRVLENTTRRDRSQAPWEAVWAWLALPRLSPAAVLALLALPLIFLAGTREGRQTTREASMAVHQTYSNALRLYSRREDLQDKAVAVGKRIPGQLEETVDWLRKRIETEPEKSSPPKAGEPGQQSIRSFERGTSA